MAIPSEMLPTTCDIYRPYGDASPRYTSVPCQIVADLARGRYDMVPTWTHYLVLDSAVDVLDGCTRTAGSPLIVYADGDEVRVPAGATSPRYIVVWVELVDQGTPREFKRAYLARDTA